MRVDTQAVDEVTRDNKFKVVVTWHASKVTASPSEEKVSGNPEWRLDLTDTNRDGWSLWRPYSRLFPLWFCCCCRIILSLTNSCWRLSKHKLVLTPSFSSNNFPGKISYREKLLWKKECLFPAVSVCISQCFIIHSIFCILSSFFLYR